MPVAGSRLRSQLWWAMCLLPLWAMGAGSHAAVQGPPAERSPSIYGLKGTSLDGRTLNTENLRGKVVMVFYWSTDCAVCLQKMPELRANAAGWRGKPFELILVSTDVRRSDADSYARLVKLIEPKAPQFSMLWAGDADYKDTLDRLVRRLPTTLVLDIHGAVVSRHEGRIAADAWDAVADLLP